MRKIEMSRSIVDLYIGMKSGEFIVVDYDFTDSYYNDCSLHEIVKNVARFKLWSSTKDGYISDIYYSINGELVHENDLITHFFGE